MLNRNVISTAELSVILTFSQHTEVGCSVFYPDRKQSELTVATVTYMSFFLSGLQTWRPPPTRCQYNKTKYSTNVGVFYSTKQHQRKWFMWHEKRHLNWKLITWAGVAQSEKWLS